MIEVHKNGESYYIKDLTMDRMYLQNGSWIKPSKSSINEIHQAKNLKVRYDTTVCHKIEEGTVQSSKIEAQP